MNLIPVPWLSSPAAVRVGEPCNRVYINPAEWLFIDSEQKAFILAHERAHCELDTDSELLADAAGFHAFVGAGGDPQDAYRAIVENLDMSLPLSQARADQIKSLMPLQFDGYFDNGFMPTNPNAGFYPPGGGTGSGAGANNEVDENGWGSQDWLDLARILGQAAPGIILAGQGQQPPPPPGSPMLPNQRQRATIFGMPAGTFLLVVAALLATILLFIYAAKK